MRGKAAAMQWAPPNARAVPRIFGRLVRLRAAQAWLLVLFCVDVAAMLDRVSGPDVWLGPVYLLVICVATWSRGWLAGQVTGIGCMALTFAINGLSLYPHGGAEFAINVVMRFSAISIVIAVFAGVRWAYLREWWLARTDTLTGALNRQAFFELAPSAIDSHRWRLLIYADLDGLKKVNDIRGHAAGDACLQAYASVVRSVIRRGDIFARVGGDEFVIFMPVKNEAAARTVAVRLHETMNNVRAENEKLNCSVGGLAVAPGDASIDDLVRSADDLMYEAKLRGACLQLGMATNVESSEIGRSRVFARNRRVSAKVRRPEDRRTLLAPFTGEPTLRMPDRPALPADTLQQ